MIINCKNCGGSIELSEDKTFGTCEYCGSTMTFPKLDDEQRAAAFNRGNHFRRTGEFDKALAVYERIVSEDDTDAEAHWCCALCRFGIEYVEDPTTFEWIPTCHRASFDSFLEDVDYLAAVDHSDGITRRQYQKDAMKIAEVQKGIIATSQNEDPFDVFICYKESDENGNRTKDSTLAQDIYYQLTDAGYRVFFSRITLEDKGGAQYEPYIFAALNSAKIMVAVGTKAEHFNAVWVKNEWSRFLALMRKDRKKMLLPCYRDMDPYDMPEQLSVLQSYDMSKIGFVQDLLHGIKKVIDSEKKAEVKETVVVQQSVGNASTAPLLERAFMFLEDGDFASANEYCEKVLDIDPKCAEAYLGKLMAELRVKKRENLKDCAQPFDERNNYQKAVRFADENLAELLKNTNLEIRYRNAVNKKNAARSEADFKGVSELFKQISGYKDSNALAAKCLELAEFARAECLELAEFARKDAIYQHGKDYMASRSVAHQEEAISYFEQIPGHKCADEFIAKCRETIDDIIREEEEARIAAEKQAKKTKKIAIISAAVIAVIIAIVLVITLVIVPMVKYNNAVALFEAQKYEEAITAFTELGDYKDSVEQRYNIAVTLYEEGKYEEAKAVFRELGDFKDSSAQVKECIYASRYAETIDLYEEGNYEEALKFFNNLGDYKDSAEWAKKCKDVLFYRDYNAAVALYEEGKYEEAITAFTELGDYKDSAEYLTECSIFIEVLLPIKEKSANITSVEDYEELLNMYYTLPENTKINGLSVAEIIAKLTEHKDIIAKYCGQWKQTKVSGNTYGYTKGEYVSNMAAEKLIIYAHIENDGSLIMNGTLMQSVLRKNGKAHYNDYRVYEFSFDDFPVEKEDVVMITNSAGNRVETPLSKTSDSVTISPSGNDMSAKMEIYGAECGMMFTVTATYQKA